MFRPAVWSVRKRRALTPRSWRFSVDSAIASSNEWLPVVCEFEVDVGPEIDVLRVALGRIAPGTFVAPDGKSVTRLAAVSPWADARCLVLPCSAADELGFEIDSAAAASRFLEAALDFAWLQGGLKPAKDAPEEPLVRQLESQVKDWRSLGLVQVARSFESAVLPLLEGAEPRAGWLTPVSLHEQRIVDNMQWFHIVGLLLHSALLPVSVGWCSCSSAAFQVPSLPSRAAAVVSPHGVREAPPRPPLARRAWSRRRWAMKSSPSWPTR